jgi:hypothetical protein
MDKRIQYSCSCKISSRTKICAKRNKKRKIQHVIGSNTLFIMIRKGADPHLFICRIVFYYIFTNSCQSGTIHEHSHCIMYPFIFFINFFHALFSERVGAPDMFSTAAPPPHPASPWRRRCVARLCVPGHPTLPLLRVYAPPAGPARAPPTAAACCTSHRAPDELCHGCRCERCLGMPPRKKIVESHFSKMLICCFSSVENCFLICRNRWWKWLNVAMKCWM